MEYRVNVINGVKIHIVIDDISNLRLIQSKAKYPLSQFFINGEKPNAIINCSYFTNEYVIGRNQGDLLQNTSSFADKGWLGFALKDDLSYAAGPLDWWDVEKSVCGFTPSTINILNGKDVELYTTEFNPSFAADMSQTRCESIFGILSDKRTCLLVTAEKGLTGYIVVNHLKANYTFDFLCCLDNGGSTEMIVDGTIKQKSTDGTERKMFNGLAFVDSPQKEEQQGPIIADISSYQGNVDFKKLKSKVDGAIIRLGFTGYGANKPTLDSRFEDYYKGLKEVGCPVGIYYFTLAQSEEMAIEEANFVLRHIKGKEINLPIYIDVESQTGSKGWTNLSKADRTRFVKKFCEEIQENGYYVGIYSNTSWLNNQLNMSDLKHFSVWVAQYDVTKPTYMGDYHMWQYTSKGSGKDYGVSSDYIDLSIPYVNFEEIIKKANLNHLPEDEDKDKKIAELNKIILTLKDMNNTLDQENKRLQEENNVLKSKLEEVRGIVNE